MTLTTSNEGTTHIIAIEGWLDTKTAPELEAKLAEVPEEAEELVLDMTAMEYISSAGIRQLVAAYKKMNGHIRLRGVRPEVRDVMRMTGMDKRFPME